MAYTHEFQVQALVAQHKLFSIFKETNSRSLGNCYRKVSWVRIPHVYLNEGVGGVAKHGYCTNVSCILCGYGVKVASYALGAYVERRVSSNLTIRTFS